jgi:hypothetical protein
MPAAPIAKLGGVDIGEQVLAGTEQYRRDCEVQFIDESGAQVFSNGRDPAADAHVAATGSGPGGP